MLSITYTEAIASVYYLQNTLPNTIIKKKEKKIGLLCNGRKHLPFTSLKRKAFLFISST